MIDEETGRPIFTVDGQDGVISTAICCLDREKAQRYAIQVVATDGGGLKGEWPAGTECWRIWRNVDISGSLAGQIRVNGV